MLTSVKQGVAGKHDLVVAVLHKEADAVLGVAGGVQGLDRDAADVEGLAVLGRPGHLLAVLAADDLEGLAELGELGGVSELSCQRLMLRD
jgi:hypothetical protein